MTAADLDLEQDTACSCRLCVQAQAWLDMLDGGTLPAALANWAVWAVRQPQGPYWQEREPLVGPAYDRAYDAAWQAAADAISRGIRGELRLRAIAYCAARRSD